MPALFHFSPTEEPWMKQLYVSEFPEIASFAACLVLIIASGVAANCSPHVVLFLLTFM